MNSSSWLVQVCEEVKTECVADFVELWWIVAEVRAAKPDISEKARRDATLTVVRVLLESGDIVAGIPVATAKFKSWNLSSSDALERIEREWDGLGREPTIGDIVWFVHRSVVTLVE